MRPLLLVFSLLVCAKSALAHAPGYTRLSLTVDAAAIRGTLHIDARDLDAVLRLDRQGDGLSIDEIASGADTIVAHVARRLELHTERGECALQPGAVHLHESWVVVPLTPRCPAGARRFSVRYDLFFEHDRAHRGHLALRHGDETSTAVFTSDRRSHELVLGAPAPLGAFRAYLIEGVWHIWLGFDHVLFLLTLLLPWVLGCSALRTTTREVFGIVTAFTIAHSLTLALAGLDVVALPSRLVESMIALSVAVAALHNLRPLFPGHANLVAFGFGLVHGFGFASVLGELGLPPGQFALGLFAFNLGVELGQLALVAVIFPLAFAARRWHPVQTYGVRLGSLAVIAVACIWFVERAFELPPAPADLGRDAVARAAAADTALREGRFEDARDAHEAALGAYETRGDAEGMATQHHRLAGLARIAGDLPSAAQALRRSISVRERLGDAPAIARESVELAQIYRQLGQIDDAATVLRAGAPHAEQLGPTSPYASYLGQLALALQLQGALDEARRTYAQAVTLVERLGPDPQLASVLANAAAAARTTGDHAEARALYQRALARFEAAGMADHAERVRGLLAEL